ncbi:MAG: hypothetical protein ACFFBV_11065 [Promethearchaeota archaeon]
MPHCNDCGYKFKGTNIKICEKCGSENISLNSDEFDIEKYKKDMKTYSKRVGIIIGIIFVIFLIIFISLIISI